MYLDHNVGDLHRESLIDVNENDIFGFLIIFNDGKTMCHIKSKPCKSKDEWDVFMKEIMED